MKVPLFAPMYERIARTGPDVFAMKPPPPRLNVSSLRPQPKPTWTLSPSRMSTPVASPALTASSSSIHLAAQVL